MNYNKEKIMAKCANRKEKKIVPVDPSIMEKVRATSKNGKLSCAEAFKLADELGVPVRKIGEACDADCIKIAGCQLGCF